MNRPKSIWFTLLLLAILIVTLEPAWGQEVTAAITGTVIDPSGAPIPSASVTATDTQRGVSWPTKTNEVGVYYLPRVPIGSYTLKVEAQGFQSVVRPAFTLVLNQTARIDITMKMGQVSETVEVTGLAPVLQTETTEVSTLIDNNIVSSVPLSSRNYLQLTLLAPGATNVDPDGMRQPQSMLDSGRPYINGNREQANAYLLDGQINTESKNNEVGYTPGVDAVQEFNLITQNASAEFGNYQGGVVSVGIKSGTNNFHGELFEYLRNDVFNANNYWAGSTKGLENFKNLTGFDSNGVGKKPELRYNQFGGTFGGPIVKNKLFFFLDYQGQRFVNASNTGIQLLTKDARAGNFGGVCTDFGGTFNSAGVCSIATQQLTNPVTGASVPFNNLATAGVPGSLAMQNLFASKYYPLPMLNTLNGNNYFFNSGHTLNNNQGDVKIDYKISDKDAIFGRWSQMNLVLDPFTGLPIAYNGDGGAIRGGSTEPVRNSVLNWTHVFGNTLINEARIGFNAVSFNQSKVPTSSLGNLGEQFGIGGANFREPGLLELAITGSGFGANAAVGQVNYVQIFHDTQIQFDDNLIYTHGRHSIKTGFQYVRLRQDWMYAGNNGALGFIGFASTTGNGLSDAWYGATGYSQRDTFVNPTVFKDRGNILAAYLQDAWRVTNNLTLNVGLRFEDHTPLTEANNRIVNFNIKTGAVMLPGQNGNNDALYNNYLGLGAFQPRIGLAWSPGFLGGKTVVRAGYAISSFYEGLGSNEALSMNVPYGIVAMSPLSGAFVDAGYPPLPVQCPNGINLDCEKGIRIRIVDQNFQPAITQQYNLTIQHQISNTLTAQIGYVGQKGSHLANFEDLTQSIGLNAQGKVAKPGEVIVNRIPGPYLGGGTPGSLYMADNGNFGGAYKLAGATMSNASQRYDALQAVLQKRTSHGLQGQLSYSWAKCLSDSPGYFGTGWGSSNAQSSGGQPGWQNIYDPRADWGPCYFDQTHVVAGQATYALPFGKGKVYGNNMNPVANAVVGGWEVGSMVSFHTGNALTLNMWGNWWPLEGDTSLTNGIAPFTLSARPNCDGPISVVKTKVPANAATQQGSYIQWFDTSNISVPPVGGNNDPANYNAFTGTYGNFWTPTMTGMFGNCGIGNIRGPHYADADLSLHKNFQVSEGKVLEFRMEALNAFNHPALTFSQGPTSGSFDMPQSNGNFGHITGSQGARQLQFALKFIF